MKYITENEKIGNSKQTSKLSWNIENELKLQMQIWYAVKPSVPRSLLLHFNILFYIIHYIFIP